jgi:hypothetical protein
MAAVRLQAMNERYTQLLASSIARDFLVLVIVEFFCASGIDNV